jgi:UDP-glucose 4-epimerase
VKISIVGYTGFIGKHLHGRFKDKGSVNAFNTVELPFNSKELNPRIRNQDVIYWVASSVRPNSSQSNLDRIESELYGWSNFLKLLQPAPPKKLVFLSSGGCVYKAGIPPFSETNATEGTNAYGKLKVEMEEILQESKIPFTILRVANVYGPGQPVGRGQGVIAEWANSIALNEPLPLFGSSSIKRDFVNVDDVCDAIEAAARFDCDSIFNVGSGEAIALKDLFTLFKKITGLNLQLAQSESREIDREIYFLDISHAKNSLNWEPKISLEDGLRIVLRERGIPPHQW